MPCLLSFIRLHLKYSTIFEAYTLSDILEYNDVSEEECLEFLVDKGFIILPEVTPLEFE